MIVGIDFGTCYSSVATMQGEKILSSITANVEDKNCGIPSIAMYSTREGRLVYGIDCLGPEGKKNKDWVIKHIKKMVRENPKALDDIVRSNQHNFAVGDILTGYLEYVISAIKQSAKEVDGFDNYNIEAITVTAPAGTKGTKMTANAYNKLLLEQMARITGLPSNKINVIEEPVAAAISYIHTIRNESRNGKKCILVFDLGGGTLDISIVEHDFATNKTSVLTTAGDLELGGNDWDKALATYILNEVGCDEGDFRDDAQKARFMDAVISLKHNLTVNDEDFIDFRVDDHSEEIDDFSRDTFERITSHLLDKAMDLVKSAVKTHSSSGMAAIDQIVLVGGGSNMPQIKRRLAQEFPSHANKITSHAPSKAIANGAVIYSDWVNKGLVNKDKTDTSNSRSSSEGFSAIATHTYGFMVKNSSYDRDMIYNLIYKGSSFEGMGIISRTADTAFVGQVPEQEIISFRIYESDAKDNGDPWMDMGNGEYENGISMVVKVPSEYAGRANEYRCYVTLELDKDGILLIKATDEKGNVVATN